MPSNQQQIIEQAKFPYSALGKAFEKQTKTIKDQGEEQFNALKSLESSDEQLSSIKDFMSKERLNPEIANEIQKIEEEKRKADRSKMVYEGSNKTYDYGKFKTIPVSGNVIRNNIINMSMKNDEQNQLSMHIREFKSQTRPQNSESKKVNEDVLNSAKTLLKGREMAFKAFESGILLKTEKIKKGTGLKVLTAKQMLKRLSIAITQIKEIRN